MAVDLHIAGVVEKNKAWYVRDTKMASKREPPPNEKEVLRILIQEVIDATANKNLASEAFEKALSQFPTGLPHPDGSHRIKNRSAELATARKDVMTAHSRLNDFLEHGIVPEDLKADKVGAFHESG
jgi:transcriptional regulator of met regulon